MYKLRYYTEYYDIHGGETRIEIHEQDYTGDPAFLKAGTSPLIIERPEEKNIFKSVRGSGATMTFLSSETLRDLYTNDVKKYKVNIYKDGLRFWTGFVNPEYYSEAINVMYDYIQVIANDGLKLLKNIPFTKPNGEPYTDSMTVWDLLKLIFGKAELDFKHINVALECYEKRMDTNSSPLHQTVVDCNNYYNEKGEPMTCREVVEGVLEPFNACLFWDNDSLNILDTTLLGNDTIHRRKYNSSYTYLETEVIIPKVDKSSNNMIFLKELNNDIEPGYNQQVIKFSPYPSEILINTAFDKLNFGLNSGSRIDEDHSDADNPKKILSNIDHVTWKHLNGGGFIGTKKLYDSEFDDWDFSFKYDPKWRYDYNINSVNNGVHFEYFKGYTFKNVLRYNASTYNIAPSTNVKLQLGMKVFIESEKEYKGARLYSLLSTGNQYYKDDTWNNISNGNFVDAFDSEIDTKDSSPATTDFMFHLDIRDFDDANNPVDVTNKWITIEHTIPMTVNELGKLKFSLLDNYEFMDDEGNTTINKNPAEEHKYYTIEGEDRGDFPIGYSAAYGDKVEFIEIKEFKFEIVDAVTNQVLDDGDLEFVGVLDERFSSKAPDMELIHADSWQGCTDRGAFIIDNQYTKEWKYSTDNDYYRLTDHLMRASLCNYKKSKNLIKGTVKPKQGYNFFTLDGNPNAGFGFHNTLAFSEFPDISALKFMMIGGRYDDRNQQIEGTWLEISPVDLNEDLQIAPEVEDSGFTEQDIYDIMNG